MAIAKLFGKKNREKNDAENKDKNDSREKFTSSGEDESQKKPRMKTSVSPNKIEDRREFDGILLPEPLKISKKRSQINMLFSNQHSEESESYDEDRQKFYEKKYFKDLAEINNSMQEEKNKKSQEVDEEEMIGMGFKEREEGKFKLGLGKIFGNNSEEKATSPRTKPQANPYSPRDRTTFHEDEKKYASVSSRSPRSGSVSISGNSSRISDPADETKNSSLPLKNPKAESENSSSLKNQFIPNQKEYHLESISSDESEEKSTEHQEFVRKFSVQIPVKKEKSLSSPSEEQANTSSALSPRGGNSVMSGIKRKLSFHAKLPIDELPNSSQVSPRPRLTTDQIAELFSGPWHFSLDEHGNPDLGRIPEKILVSLSKDAHKIIHHDAFGKKTPDGQKAYLKQELGKRFIKLVEEHLTELSDDKALGSPERMKSYLKSKFRIIIGDEKSQKKLSKAAKNNDSSGELGEESTEFHEVLSKNLLLRMKNYKLDYMYAENSQEEKAWLLHSIDVSLIKNYKSDKAEDSPIKKISATFQRDFSHSTYQLEDEEGNQTLISDIQDFIDFFDGSTNEELCYNVSHHACQNLPIMLRNVFFGRLTNDGDFVSVLHLDDGTPVGISDTTKSTYTFKKQPNGGILLKYKGLVAARSVPEVGRGNATLLLNTENGWERKSVFIANASAEYTWEISFDADGKADYSTKPKIVAEGWNQFAL